MPRRKTRLTRRLMETGEQFSQTVETAWVSPAICDEWEKLYYRLRRNNALLKLIASVIPLWMGIAGGIPCVMTLTEDMSIPQGLMFGALACVGAIELFFNATPRLRARGARFLDRQKEILAQYEIPGEPSAVATVDMADWDRYTLFRYILYPQAF